MTTTQIHGVTLSAHAGLNWAECFGADPRQLVPATDTRKGDFARSPAGKARRNHRRAARSFKRSWLEH